MNLINQPTTIGQFSRWEQIPKRTPTDPPLRLAFVYCRIRSVAVFARSASCGATIPLESHGESVRLMTYC